MILSIYARFLTTSTSPLSNIKYPCLTFHSKGTGKSEGKWTHLIFAFWNGRVRLSGWTNWSFRRKKWHIIKFWLVVEPTHLKKMLVKLGSSSPNRCEHKKCLKPPPRIPVADLLGFQWQLWRFRAWDSPVARSPNCHVVILLVTSIPFWGVRVSEPQVICEFPGQGSELLACHSIEVF